MIIKPKYYGPAIPSTYAVALTAAAQPGIEIADDADIDMGTNDFGLIIYANFTDWTPASDTVLWEKHDGTNGVRVTLLTTGILRTTISATDFDASVATGLAASASAILTISVVRESASVAGSVTRYAGVDPIGTASAITAGAPTTVSNAVSAYVGGDGSNQQAGNYIQVVALNFAPTAADVRTVCTTGIPESWKWGSQAAQTSGALVVGKMYRINTYVAGDDFTNVGAASNATGARFTASGTTPTTWTNSSSLVKIGATLALLHNSIPTSGATAWDDSSGNTGGGTLPGAGASKVTIRK